MYLGRIYELATSTSSTRIRDAIHGRADVGRAGAGSAARGGQEAQLLSATCRRRRTRRAPAASTPACWKRRRSAAPTRRSWRSRTAATSRVPLPADRRRGARGRADRAQRQRLSERHGGDVHAERLERPAAPPPASSSAAVEQLGDVDRVAGSRAAAAPRVVEHAPRVRGDGVGSSSTPASVGCAASRAASSLTPLARSAAAARGRRRAGCEQQVLGADLRGAERCASSPRAGRRRAPRA